MSTYTLHVGGLTRELPIVTVSTELSVASFVILGDTELVRTTAPLLAEMIPSLPKQKEFPSYTNFLNNGMSRYVVARKNVKPYMGDPLVDTVESITTQKEQQLVIEKNDGQFFTGKTCCPSR